MRRYYLPEIVRIAKPVTYLILNGHAAGCQTCLLCQQLIPSIDTTSVCAIYALAPASPLAKPELPPPLPGCMRNLRAGSCVTPRPSVGEGPGVRGKGV